MQSYGFCRGALNKVFYGKALPLGPTPSQIPFLDRKGTVFPQIIAVPRLIASLE